MGVADAVRGQLLECCRQRNITVNYMCELSAVPQSTVSNFLNRKSHNLGIITLKKLLDGLDVSLQEFFAGECFIGLEQEIK